MDRPLIAIAGATASGKSSLAMQTALKFNGEIVSVDSMQLYRDIPIGTAQPSDEDKAAVKHHLTGIYELRERAEVFRFCAEADAVIKDIFSRGKLPVLCGGTGLYLKALMYGLDDLPGDRNLRNELDMKYDSDEKEHLLHEEISKLDPLAFEKWKMCRRKLIRAMEVFLLTGKSIVLQQQGMTGKLRYNAKIFVIDHENEILKQRIAERCSQMLAKGWIEEADSAIKKGLFQSPTAHQVLGYKQIASYLNGEITHELMTQKIITATWQYARRQKTWFKHQHPEAEIIPFDRAAEKIYSAIHHCFP